MDAPLATQPEPEAKKYVPPEPEIPLSKQIAEVAPESKRIAMKKGLFAELQAKFAKNFKQKQSKNNALINEGD